MTKSRFIVLPDERNLILGRDIAGLFEKGIIYQYEKVCGEIIFCKVGKPVIAKKLLNHTANEIISTGFHLITTKEYDKHDRRRNERSLNN